MIAELGLHRARRVEIGPRDDPNDPSILRFKDDGGDVDFYYDNPTEGLICEADLIIQNDLLTLGDGTANDITILFDDDGSDVSLLWDESVGQFVMVTGFMSVRGAIAGVGLDDTDVSADAVFETALQAVCTGAASSENCYLQVSNLSAGEPISIGHRIGYDTDDEPLLGFVRGLGEALSVYTASNTLDFSGALGYRFTDAPIVAGTTIDLEGATDDANEVIIQVGADPGADVTLTLPTATGTLLSDNTEKEVCEPYDALVAADDNVPLFHFNGASTVTKIGCDSDAAITVSVEDGGGTDVDADLVCSTGGTVTWDASFTGTASFTDGEKIQFDTISESTPTWTTICFAYTTP
jgi:hypothetical protein